MKHIFIMVEGEWRNGALYAVKDVTTTLDSQEGTRFKRLFKDSPLVRVIELNGVIPRKFHVLWGMLLRLEGNDRRITKLASKVLKTILEQLVGEKEVS